MTIACKLWLLAVVCIAFLYQDGPQGNGVLCKKKVTHSDEDNSSGAQSSGAQSSGSQSSDVEDDDQNSDDQSGDSSGGNDSDGDGVGKSHDISDVDDDDEDEEHDKNSKNKHKAHKKSGHGKHHHDDDDSEDSDDDEHVEDDDDDDDDDEDPSSSHNEKHKKHHKKCKKNNDEDVQVLTSTTITGKPKDVLKFLNKAVKPYKPVSLDFKKKSNSELFKNIEAVTKRNKSSKGKKESGDDLSSFMSNILRASLKKKNSKQVDPDKVLITLVKSVLLQLLKNI